MLIRKVGEQIWHQPAGTTYTGEASLEALLEESPALLPGPDDDKPVAVARQLTVGTGSIDLLGISRSGAITIVECKLQDNPEIRRRVVGQVFAYAAALWGEGYEDLERAFQLRKKTTLVEAVRAGLPDGDDAWDETSFRQAVSGNLSTGRFRLVLAVDAITAELRRIVEYLNDHTVDEVVVLALELAFITSDGVEILEPRLYGVESAERKQPPQGRQWDETSFLQALAGRGEEQRLARAVLEWATERGLRVWYGKGRVDGTLLPILDLERLWFSFFALKSSRRVELQFGTLKSRPPFDRSDLRLELLHRLNSIPGIAIPEAKADAYPSFPFQSVFDDARRQAFLETIDWAIDTIRASVASG